MDEVANLSNEQIESELVAHAAWEATAMGKVLDLLAEFDRRKLWESWGAYSAQQWLGWKCGLGYIAASERLRVARALRDLPWIRNAISRGKLSYSKVRELTRVVTAATDRCLGEIATAATAPQLATTARPSIARSSFAPFLAPPPGNPDWITGDWCGERLSMVDTMSAIEFCESRDIARSAA